MVRKILGSVVVAALATAAYAQPSINIVDLGLGGGLAGGDVEVVVAADDAWTAGGIAANSLVAGVTMVCYNDPNTGTAFTAPETAGSASRNVSFVSLPRDQNTNARFRTAGAATIVGAYSPAGPAAICSATQFNVAYAEIPPTFLQGTGYTQRLVVDYSGSAYAGETVYAATAPASPGDVQLVSVETAIATQDFASPLTIQRWGIYATPEPASLALLALGALAAIRRR